MKIAKFIFIVFVVLFSAGCGKNVTNIGGKQVKKIRLAIWGSPDELKIVTAIIEEWQKKHSDIKVVLEHTPYGGYASKILTRIAGGDAPDVIAAEVGLFTNFWYKKVFLDLTPLVKQDAEFSINDYFPQIVNHFTVDGKIYGIPRDIAPFACIYYNKNLFDREKIPYPDDNWDWNQFLATARRLTKYDQKGKVIQYGFYTWAWQNFILSNGGALVDDIRHPTRLALDMPESKGGLKFYRDLITKYKVSPTPSALINMGMGVQMMFMTGRLAMLGSGIWESPALRKITDFDWDIVMFPKNPAGIRKFATGGTGYCLLKTSKYPQAAWQVIKALTSRRAMERMASMGLAQPAMISVAEGPYWAKSSDKPLNKIMLNEAAKYVVFPPFHGNWREIEELNIKPSLDLIFSGRKSIDTVISDVVYKGNKLLR